MSNDYLTDMGQFGAAQEEDIKNFRNFYTAFVSDFSRIKPASFIVWLVLASVFFALVRPQNLPGLQILGTLRLPIVISVLTGLLTMQYFRRNFQWPFKAWSILMSVQVIRGLVGVYLDPNDYIVRNDFWHFEMSKILLLQFLGLHLPVAACLTNRVSLEKICSLLALSGAFLGIWGLTHNGQGPGGYFGDENDLCFGLLTLMPFAGLMLVYKNSKFKKFLYVCCVVACLLGIISTVSRGGMLGLVALLGFLFLYSQKKLFLLGLSLFILVFAVPFVPEEFKSEFTSIGEDVGSNKGTVKQRKELWSIAWAVFTKPVHLPFGVGLNNLTYWFADYEQDALRVVQRSRAGRAVHSMYFQLLPELGLFGAFLVGSIFYWCFSNNRKSIKGFQRIEHQLGSISPTDLERVSSRYGATASELGFVVESFQVEQRLIRYLGFALNCSFVGGLVSAIAISVLYYPPMWLLMALSVSLSYYSKRTYQHYKLFTEMLEASSEIKENAAPD